MLSTPLTKSTLRTTDNYIKALAKAGFLTVWDLLEHYPRDYEDRTEVLQNFSLINVKEKNTCLVKLLSLDTKKTAGNKLLSKAVFEDENGFMAEAVWFNRKYFASQMQAYIGKKILITWKVRYAFWTVTFQSPDTETDLSKVWWEIVPVYSDINYIPSKWLQPKIKLLEKYIQGYSETLPDNIMEKYAFISKKEAIYKVHFPKNMHDIELAKYRLAYEELYDINFWAISKKYENFAHSEGKSIAIPMDVEFIKDLLTKLPFELTNHQKIVLFQVLKDMEKTHAMQRLVEWDVWTGKTIVALISAIHAILKSGEDSDLSQQELTPNPQQEPHPNPLLRGEGEEGMRTLYKTVPSYVKDLSKTLRSFWTDSEKILWEVLRNRQFEWLKFRRQHPIGRYIADFYCDEIKLVVELDGKIHDNQKEYDALRDEVINWSWINVERIKSADAYEDISKIFEKIYPYIPSPLRRGLGWGDENGEASIKLGWGNETIVAKSWALHTSRIQVAIMAPTEILARQHFSGMQNLLFEFGISSELLVWSVSAKNKKAIKERLVSGNLDVIIGTHALVQEDVLFHNLWYVIIDEQHRFGVKQREVLENGLWNRSGLIPHSLNMTATPIPRTLALTLYGDQDLSIISEYPKWRKEIFTKVAKTENNRRDIENFIRSQLEKWRQAFWVSPLVEESEKIDLANAISTYESLIEIFAPFKVWLVHGKMKAKEKEQIMSDFKDNKIQVLSSTSVIEVGVDIPNASIMCIEWAERFGLSQLHQFRGRVGRGEHQSYCYLFPSAWNYTDRLKAMEKTNNGFELSEIDLEIRWPGEVYGLRQSWVPDLKVADLRDLELISQIREDIEGMFEDKS